MFRKFTLLFLLSFLTFAVGCGGSADSGGTTTDDEGGAGAIGGTGAALTVSEKMSVVDAQDSVVDANVSSLMKAAVSALPPSSEYFTDRQMIFVQERSTETLNMVNEILCMIGQTGYRDMVNLGDYAVQIDETLCKGNDIVEGQGSSSADGSSGSEAPHYLFATANSYRADDESPHVLALWMHMPGSEFDPAMLVEARANIYAEPSDSNPYGLFQMYFRGSPEEAPGTEVFKAYLITEEGADGSVELKFYDHGEFEGEGETMSFTERLSLVRDGDSISGSAGVEEISPFHNSSAAFDFASNADLFHRGITNDEGTNEVCLSRTEFDETTWRYNLYETEDASSPGNRVERNSGFPVKFIDGSEESHGHVGYWGAWFPGETQPENGDTVYKMDFNRDGPPTETPYTLYKSEGKLKRHTLESIPLGEIAGVPLSWFRCDESGCAQWRVEWDKDEQRLYQTGQMNQERWIWEDLEDPIAVTLGESDWSFNFWSEALNGDGMIPLINPSDGERAVLSNSTAVTFHREDVVYPGDDDLPTNLVCFENCPDVASLGGEQPYFPQSLWEAGEEAFSNIVQTVPSDHLEPGTHYIPYTFDPESMVLEYQGNAVVMPSGATTEFGIWTGFLMEPTDANFEALACNWDASATCVWEARSTLASYYTYETGNNQWNYLTLLREPSSGDFLEFEPPLMLEYTHTNGNTYFVHYGSVGDLWGIPGKCVDMDSGLDIDCGAWEEDKPIRWVPEFSIPDGSVVSDIKDGTEYYVKGMDREQRMIAVDQGQCTDAGLTLTPRTLPDETLYRDPNIGDEPNVTNPPAYIGGIAQ